MSKYTGTAPALHLNPNVRGMRRSATIRVNERSNELVALGKRVYKLGLGQSPFPVPEEVQEALRRNAGQKDYLPVAGLKELREAIAAQHQEKYGLETRPEQVLVGPGSKELMFILQLVYDGEILIPTPAWVSYDPQARILGGTVRLIPTTFESGWRLQPDQLDEVCSSEPDAPKLLVLNYPKNPTGLTYSLQELEGIAEVARKHRVLLLSDEIYSLLMHSAEHHSIVPMHPEGTIFSGGLSKWCGAGGWRLGMFIIPPEMNWLMEAMATVASETYTSTSAPIQYAAITAFRGSPALDLYLAHANLVLGGLGNALATQLIDVGSHLHLPQGGFYLFPDFEPFRQRLAARGVHGSTGLAEQLLVDTGVATLPGEDFGRPEAELTLRLSYVNFDGGACLEALARGAVVDETFIASYCPETVEAINRLCEWLGPADP